MISVLSIKDEELNRYNFSLNHFNFRELSCRVYTLSTLKIELTCALGTIRLPNISREPASTVLLSHIKMELIFSHGLKVSILTATLHG